MNILGRVVRRIILRGGRGLRRRRGLIALSALLIASWVVSSSFDLRFPDVFSYAEGGTESSYSSDCGAPPTTRPDTGPGMVSQGALLVKCDDEPAATSSYIRGQQDYDAQLVWNAYSDRLQQAYEQRGAGIDEVQRQLEASKRRGPRIEQAHYVGSFAIPNGQMAFYVVAQSTGARGTLAYVSYTFTLDASGKIDKVE